MTSNYETVIKALRNYRERLRSSRGIRGKLSQVDRLIVKSRQNLSHIEDPSARRALELTLECRKSLCTILYRDIFSYCDQSKNIEDRILSQTDTPKSDDEDTATGNNCSIDPTNQRAFQKHFKRLGEIGQTFAVPSFKQWQNKCQYLDMRHNREMKINAVCRYDIPSDISWWRTTMCPYKKGNESFYNHIISRHGVKIADECGLNSDADVVAYLSRLAASTNEATCMQFKQFDVVEQNGLRVLLDKRTIVKLDTETNVGILLSVDNNGKASPITAFIVNKGYLRCRVASNASNRKWE